MTVLLRTRAVSHPQNQDPWITVPSSRSKSSPKRIKKWGPFLAILGKICGFSDLKWSKFEKYPDSRCWGLWLDPALLRTCSMAGVVTGWQRGSPSGAEVAIETGRSSSPCKIDWAGRLHAKLGQNQMLPLPCYSRTTSLPAWVVMRCRQKLENTYLSQFRKCLGCQNLDNIPMLS